jgi:hypothetical protein
MDEKSFNGEAPAVSTETYISSGIVSVPESRAVPQPCDPKLISDGRRFATSCGAEQG